MIKPFISSPPGRSNIEEHYLLKACPVDNKFRIELCGSFHVVYQYLNTECSLMHSDDQGFTYTANLIFPAFEDTVLFQYFILIALQEYFSAIDKDNFIRDLFEITGNMR